MKIKKVLTIIVIVLMFAVIAPVLYFVFTVSQSKPMDFSSNSKGIEMASKEDYNNCIILEKEEITVITSGEKSKVSYDNFFGPSTILEKMKDREVNTIMTENIDYGIVVKTLDQITIHDVKKYKLLKSL